MNWYTFLSGIISGFFLLSGLFSLFLHIRRIEREINLPYFIFAFSLAGVMLHGLYVTGSADLAVKLQHDRIVSTLFGVAGVGFLFLVSGLTGFRPRLPLALLLAGLGVYVALGWLLPYGTAYSEVSGITSYDMLWGESRSRIDGTAGASQVYVIVLLLAILLYAVFAVIRHARQGDRRHARLLALTIVIGLSGIIIDELLLLLRRGGIGFIDDIGFIAFVLLIGHRNFQNIIHSNELIRESREHFSRLTEAAFEGIGFTKDGIIVDVNRQLSEMLGYEPDELIGQPVMILIAPHHRERVRFNTQSEDIAYEHDALRKDGSIVPVEVRVKNVRMTDHDLRVAVIRDVSERRRAEQLNFLLAQALKSARDCISITDEQGRLIFVNDAFLQNYGYTEQEILGRNIAEVRAPGAFAEAGGDYMPGSPEGSWYGVVLNRRKDGTVFPIELWTSVAHDADGRELAHVGVARNVSDRREAEKALIAAKEQAERSDRLKDAFIANISHEIRTPLNIILGYTSLIADSIRDRVSDAELEYFESVQRGASRLMRTVDLILSMSRLQVGDVEIDPVQLDLAQVAREITNDYRSAAGKKNLKLLFEADDNGALIVADEYSITQLLHNLLDNALKYTQSGSVTVRVARVSDGGASVCVIDTGIGISEEYLPLIFSPYSQEDSGLTRGYDGIGLGLSLVKRYAELNSARVEIESTKGLGTTVRVVFPEGTSALRGTSVEGTGDVPAQTARMRVLLVEDDPLTIEFMRTLFAREFEFRHAPSAEEALRIVSGQEFDFILMDISLSGKMTGLDLTRTLKASPVHAHIPIIAVTAHGFSNDRQRCLDAGCDEYLVKPVGRDELLAAMLSLSPTTNRNKIRDSESRPGQ